MYAYIYIISIFDHLYVHNSGNTIELKQVIYTKGKELAGTKHLTPLYLGLPPQRYLSLILANHAISRKKVLLEKGAACVAWVR